MKLKYIVLILSLFLGVKAFGLSVYKPIELDKKEIIFSESVKQINVFNPTPATNSSGSMLPGGRGPNQLVVYTSEFGDRTNTNEFGTEVVVQGNVVTMISGANSLIPQDDGIVISGHGSAKNWIKQNIEIGTKVYIDSLTNSLHVYTTSDSYKYEAEEKIKETEDMIDYYKGILSDYSFKSSLSSVQNAKNYIKRAEKCNEDEECLQEYSRLALMEANTALVKVLPYIDDEVKGVWIRPTEKSATEIIKTLDRMKYTGIDNVFIETFYHGKTIFPSKTMEDYGIITQNEDFNTFDPLKVWIDEAHKRNIKVHIWFQSFYVGNKPISDKSILGVYQSWGNKIRVDADKSLPTRSKSEHNGYFLDPANPDVQNFLVKLVTEIINTYHPDGINLDYIRYPQAISKYEAGSWGYTEFARNEFKEIYGFDPVNLTKSDGLWKEWNAYRREKITKFVCKIGELGRANGVFVSAVIFPDIENALATKQQDWRTWSRRNYIDGFTPLFLTYDSEMVAKMMKNVMAVKSDQTKLYAGLFVTFMGGSVEDLIRQIHETRKLKSDGVILFDYAHTTQKYTSCLANSAFLRPAQSKEQNKSNKKLFNRKKSKK